MFLHLNHQNLEGYQVTKSLVKEVYEITLKFPDREKFLLCDQVRRAAISVKLNLSEGSSRSSENERKRYFEISRGSLVELNAALETAVDLKYVSKDDLTVIGLLIVNCFKLFSGLLNKLKQNQNN